MGFFQLLLFGVIRRSLLFPHMDQLFACALRYRLCLQTSVFGQFASSRNYDIKHIKDWKSGNS